jgi:hypothetical protein
MKSDTSLYEARFCSRLVFNRAPSIAGDSAHPTLTAKYDHSSRMNPEAPRTPHPPTLSTCQPLDTLIPRKGGDKITILSAFLAPPSSNLGAQRPYDAAAVC